MTHSAIVVMRKQSVRVCQSCCDLKCECCCCCHRSVPPRDELGLRRDFYLSQHHIPHILTYKSPCAVHLKAPLAFGSVNLFVVRLSNENSNQKCLDGIELWSDTQ